MLVTMWAASIDKFCTESGIFIEQIFWMIDRDEEEDGMKRLAPGQRSQRNSVVIFKKLEATGGLVSKDP